MERAPLANISGNRVHNTELNVYQRGMIMGGHAFGHSLGEIGNALNLPRATVQTTIQRHSERNDGESKSRSERPRMLSIRDKRYIIRLARQNPRMTYAQLRQKREVHCSRITIYRTLKEYDLIN